MNDVTWWKAEQKNPDHNDPQPGRDVPGDTNASDIVGRTGEEMPEVAHDQVDNEDEVDDPLDGAITDPDLPVGSLEER